MIDTYFDRADAASGYKPTPAKQLDRDDPRYWNGSMYASAIDCAVAMAKYRLRIDIAYIHHRHARAIREDFRQARARIGVES